MKTTKKPSAPASVVGEDEIRHLAYQLYLESGSIPDRDLDNWLAAKAHLEAKLTAELPATPPAMPSKKPRSGLARIVELPASDAFASAPAATLSPR